MAETLLPSVRGRTRTAVAALAFTAATASGALVGLVAGIAAAPLRWLAPSLLTIDDDVTVVAVLVAVGLILDGVALTSGRWRPLALGRQVPREWGRWLGPRVVAVLYGTRLGIGPSTMLSTWTWWSATVAAALIGPGPSALVGGVFGAVRIVLTILATMLVASRPAPATPNPAGSDGAPVTSPHPTGTRRQFRLQPLSRIGRHDRPGWLAVDTVVAAVVVTAVLTGCTGGGDGSASPSPSSPSSSPSPSSSSDPIGVNRDPSAISGRGEGTSGANRSSSDGAGEAIRSLTDPRLVTAVTTPARLEDFVRIPSSNPTTGVLDTDGVDGRVVDGVSGAPAGPQAPNAGPEALAGSLVAAVNGFEPIDEPGADRFLNLAAAAAIQPDPPAETALLLTRGFEGGWTRAFRSPGNDVVVASVYQFADPAEAEFYLEDGLITIGGYGGRFFDLTALPGVRGFHQEIGDGDEQLQVLGAAFHTGPRWYLIYLLGSVDTVTPDVLVDVVAAQRRLASQPS